MILESTAFKQGNVNKENERMLNRLNASVAVIVVIFFSVGAPAWGL